MYQMRHRRNGRSQSPGKVGMKQMGVKYVDFFTPQQLRQCSQFEYVPLAANAQHRCLYSCFAKPLSYLATAQAATILTNEGAI